jgi:hypothetical protein
MIVCLSFCGDGVIRDDMISCAVAPKNVQRYYVTDVELTPFTFPFVHFLLGKSPKNT